MAAQGSPFCVWGHPDRALGGVLPSEASPSVPLHFVEREGPEINDGGIRQGRPDRFPLSTKWRGGQGVRPRRAYRTGGGGGRSVIVSPHVQSPSRRRIPGRHAPGGRPGGRLPGGGGGPPRAARRQAGRGAERASGRAP